MLNNKQLVNYLLTSSDLKKTANIHTKDDEGTNILMLASQYGCSEILKFLVIDMNIKVSYSTLYWLQGGNREKIIYKNTLHLLEKRNLYDKLNNININKHKKSFKI